MDQTMPLPIANWQNFYVIVGSSAGALTGLQFVVLTLIAQARVASSMREISAFGTPTVVHFCSALLISALMTVPWQSPTQLSVFLVLGGLAGVLYSLRIVWHARKSDYNPDLEDWIWYTGLPFLAHLALICSAALLWWNTNWSLSVVAADALLFLLIGIHNAWDSVTYIVVKHHGAPKGN